MSDDNLTGWAPDDASDAYAVSDRLISIFRIEDREKRTQRLMEWRGNAPIIALEAAIHLLLHSEEMIRQRAGRFISFLKSGGVPIDGQAKALAEHLEQGEDPRVRLSCAIVLMSVAGAAVDRAFRRALHDTTEKVAQIACLEVGDRGGPENTAALFDVLHHPNWRVRLEACKALITQKTADQRVVDALEAMSQDPEAAVHDAEVHDAEAENSAEMLEVFLESIGKGDDIDNRWDKLSTIIARARQVAQGTSKEESIS